MVTAGRPHHGRLIDMEVAEARRALDERLVLFLQVARNAAGKVRPEGTLLFMGGTVFSPRSMCWPIQPLTI
jgi:hypothetical protein